MSTTVSLRSRLLWLSGILLAAPALAAAATAPSGGARTAATAAPAQWVQLAERLDKARTAARVPAMSLVLFDGGRPVLLRSFGAASLDTPFRWGSITKSFTGLAALALLEESALTLETPVRDVLTADYYDNPWATTAPLSVAHLLALTAGFTDLSRDEWNDNQPYALRDALRCFAPARRMLWPPGLQHSYSNAPPGLMAAIIEAESGRSFEEYLDKTVFTPLAMEGASLEPVAGLPGGFKADGTSEIPYWHMTYRAFGALNASTAAMTRFLTALLNEGNLDGEPVLPAARVARFFEPLGSLGASAGLEIGYGAGVYGWIAHGQRFDGHGGDADGYRSRYGLLRDHGRAYLVVINTDNPRLLGSFRREIEAVLTADLPAAPAPPSQVDGKTAAALTGFAGTYYPASARFAADPWRRGERDRIRVEAFADHLLVHRGERVTRLIPHGQGRFRRPDDPAITAVFVRDRSGSLYLQGELGNFVSLSVPPCPDFLERCD